METSVDQISTTVETNAGKYVVIVDNNPADYNRLATRLRTAGWTVEIVGDASGSASEPTVVMVDVCPQGAPTLAALALLRRRFLGAKLWAITSYPSMELAVRAIKSGADLCLPKPLHPTEVCALLGEEPSPEPAPDPEVKLPSLARFEWEYITRVLQYHRGNISQTARALQIQRSTLQRRLRKYPPII
jgi:two-component system response regulator RegA